MESEAEFGFVWKWRKYLLLLTTLVVSATYVAGLNPPGGMYIEDFEGHRVGDPVLSSTHHDRYAVFFYCNAAAFLSSLVVVMILLDQRIAGSRVGFAVLRSVMLLDLLALMGAFAAGSFRDMITSIYVPVVFVALLAYVAIHLHLIADDGAAEASDGSAELDPKGRSKLPLLLATFATPLTYAAGMVPPGGAWLEDSPIERQSAAGDPVLAGTHPQRYRAFSYCNATCFVSSLTIITLLVSKRKLSGRIARSYALQVCVLLDLLGLMGAYAVGSCRAVRLNVAGAVLLYIGLFCMDTPKKWLTQACRLLLRVEQESRNLEEHDDAPDTLIRDPENIVKQQVKGSWSLLLLLGTLTAAVTYQAGLNPPGGFWREGSNQAYGLTPGSPGLLAVQPHRYNAFFYSNTTTFVASLAMIVIVQSKQQLISGSVVRRRLLQVAIILSQFGLMGAYASGSSRDISTTIYVSALAAANAVAFMTLDMLGSRKLMPWVEGMIYNILNKLRLLDHHDDGQSKGEEEEEDNVNQLEKKRKSLLQLAILAAAVTYQTGLTSTGGFWELDLLSNSRSRHITDTILLGHDRSRYLVFFYCNAAEFMVSVTVILHLVNHRRLHSQSSIRSNVLQACVMVGFLGLRTAYALGSSRKVSTSIYVIGLVVAVVTYLALQILPPLLARCVGGKPAVPPWLPSWLRRLFKPLPLRPNHQKRKINSSEAGGQQHIQEHANKYTKRKYLLLLGVLTTNMTYQAGLTPPGSTWTEYRYGIRPGDPIMASTDAVRYQAFYYCNTTSFLASVILIILLLQRTVSPRGTPLRAMQAAMALDLAGLLGAYAVARG
uniref:Uncharacterized protein n=1 Tax=Avena sativa TaxID=4498 RepID=A0ACD5Y307_AVESA